jgi:phage-related protein
MKEPNRWTVVHLNQSVDQEFEELPKEFQAKFMHLVALIEEFGLNNIGEPYVKHLEGKLWEMRIKTVRGHGRGIYCSWTGRQIVILRYFIKKTPKTPILEIKLANDRLKELAEYAGG